MIGRGGSQAGLLTNSSPDSRTRRDIGSAIRDRRRRLGLGQDELAARVGVSRKWIVDLEKGEASGRDELGVAHAGRSACASRLVKTERQRTAIRGNSIPSSTSIASSTTLEPTPMSAVVWPPHAPKAPAGRGLLLGLCPPAK
jgi:DNA-binding XRE family transcriptional regulator